MNPVQSACICLDFSKLTPWKVMPNKLWLVSMCLYVQTSVTGLLWYWRKLKNVDSLAYIMAYNIIILIWSLSFSIVLGEMYWLFCDKGFWYARESQVKMNLKISLSYLCVQNWLRYEAESVQHQLYNTVLLWQLMIYSCSEWLKWGI